jgi:hypothetical protein
MAFQKTKEQIAEEQRLFAERYPEAAESTVDPTQPTRDALKRLAASAFIPDSPLGKATADMRQAGLPKEEFEMSPDIKKYGYDLFGIKDLAGDVEQEIPFAPKEQEEPEEEPAIPQEVKPEAPVERKPSSVPAQKIQQAIEQEATRTPAALEKQEPETEDYNKMVEGVQEQQRNIRYAERLAKVRDAAIGAGLGKQFETDYGMYGELKTEAASPIQKIKIVQELDNNKAKNDPNSDISKLIRKSLADLGVNMAGMDKVSYAQIEKLYPSVANAMMTKLATEARKEEAALTRQMKAEASADKAEARRESSYEKTRTVINNKIGKLQESKTSPFNGYNQAKQTTQMLDNAIEAWDNSDKDAKIKNSVAFMQYAKLAQGDDSVVRSSDMQALAGGLNYSSPYALLNKFAAKAEGSPFTKDELVEMKKVIDTIRKVKKEQLQQRLDPIKLDAQRGGYDLDQSISPDIMEEIYSPEPMSTADKAKRLQELKKKQGK